MSMNSLSCYYQQVSRHHQSVDLHDSSSVNLNLTVATDVQHCSLQLQQHLVAFCKMQLLYMPPVSEILPESDVGGGEDFAVENMRL